MSSDTNFTLATPINPSTIGNIAAWYDIDSLPRMNHWDDKSGNDKHLSVSGFANLYEPDGGINFGMNYYTVTNGGISLSGTTGFTVFIVAKRNIVQNSPQSHYMYSTSNVANTPVLIDDYVSNALEISGDSVNRATLSSSLNQDKFITVFKFKSQQYFRGYFNETLVSSQTLTGKPNLGNFSYTHIGSTSDGGSRFTGLMYEIIFFNTELSYSQMNGVYNYLCNRHNMVAPAPAPAPPSASSVALNDIGVVPNTATFVTNVKAITNNQTISLSTLGVNLNYNISESQKKLVKEGIVRAIFEENNTLNNFKVNRNQLFSSDVSSSTELLVIRSSSSTSQNPIILNNTISTTSSIYTPLNNIGDNNYFSIGGSQFSIAKVADKQYSFTRDGITTQHSEGNHIIYNGLRLTFSSVEISLVPPSVPIDIDFDITLDASSNMVLFQGISPDLVGREVLLATYQVPVRTLYDISGNKGLIEYWEPSSELDNIYVRLADGSGSDASGVNYNFSGAYQTVAKRLAKQVEKVLVNQFDCSAAVPFSSYTSGANSDERYYKQRDFSRVALGAMAHDMFGHVDATAAISNDVAFSRAMLSLTNDASGTAAAQLGDASGGYVERYNAWSKKSDISGNVQNWSEAFSASDANLAVRIAKAIINKGLTDGQVIVSDVKAAESNSNLKTLARIVAQIINKDITRLTQADNSERTKDVHHLLKFVPGDKLYFNIRVAKPNVTVGNAAPSGALATSINQSSQERTYTIKVVLYDDSAAPQSLDSLITYA